MKFSDEELVKKYLKGNERAFEVLIKRYLKPVYSFVYHQIENKEEAEDLTQEIFVKAWKNLKKFDQKKNFKTWIFTIAKNSVIDYLRKKKKEVWLSEKILNSQNFAEKIFEETKILKEAIEKLSPKYQLVLELYYWQGLNFKEISKILKEPLNTVKSRHYRAILLLRKFILE